MLDDRQLPFPLTVTPAAAFYQRVAATLAPQTAAIDQAVRRGELDLATAAELLEHQVTVRVEMLRMMAD
jgi:hypothetical protein